MVIVVRHRHRSRVALALALASSGLLGVGSSAAAEAGELKGSVRDETGVAVPQATVTLVSSTGAAMRVATETDSSGHYRLQAPQGTYELQATAWEPSLRRDARVGDVEVGQASTLDLVMVRQVRFQGTVRDGNGAPLSGVYVYLNGSGASGDTTGDDGTFRMDTVPGTYSLVLSARSDITGGGDLSATVDGFTVDADRTEDLVLPLTSFEVTVAGSGGAFIDGAQAHLFTPFDCDTCLLDLRPGLRARSWVLLGGRAAGGSLRRVGLATPNLTAQATGPLESPGHGGGYRETRTGISGLSPSTIPIVLGATSTLSGRVTGVGGEPADNFHLGLSNDRRSSSSTQTAPGGSFAVQAPPDRYRLAVQATNFATVTEDGIFYDSASAIVESIELPDGGRQLDLAVPGVPFTVRVHGPDDRPVAGAVVTIRTGSDNWDGSGGVPVDLAPGLSGAANLTSRRTSGADGTATGSILPGADAVYLQVQSPWGSDLASTALAVSGGGPAEISLARVARLRGVVRNAQGSPLEGVAVGLQSPSALPWELTPANGAYASGALPGPTKLTVAKTYPFNAPATATLPGTWNLEADLSLSSDTVLDLTVPDAAPARVRVVGPDGRNRGGRLSLYGMADEADTLLAPGVLARARVSLMIEGDGDYRPLLFGPSTVGDGRGPPGIHLAPGDYLVFATTKSRPIAPPGAPSGVGAQAGDASATLSWVAPTDDGGAPITSFTVVTQRDGATVGTLTLPGSSTTATISGLHNGLAYTFRVTATNRAGGSLFSPTSPAVTPVASSTTPTTGAPPPTTAPLPVTMPSPVAATSPSRSGYWMLGANGRVYSFGDVPHRGDIDAGPVVDLEPTPSGEGYWVVDQLGVVHTRGDASHFGNVDRSRLQVGERVTSLSATPAGTGYWIFTTRGRVLAFGGADHFGDVAGTALNGPVLDSIPTPSGQGYYMVASDGGIFAFGDARFAGSMGGQPLNAPVESLVPDGDGHGYWLVASDGGVFAFEAGFRGSMGAVPLNRPIAGMVRYGNGYLMVGEDGGIFNFSDRDFAGSLGDRPPDWPVVAVATPMTPN